MLHEVGAKLDQVIERLIEFDLHGVLLASQSTAPLISSRSSRPMRTEPVPKGQNEFSPPILLAGMAMIDSASTSLISISTLLIYVSKLPVIPLYP